MKQTNQNNTQQKNSYFNNATTTQDQIITQFLQSLTQQNQPQQTRQGFDDNMSDWNPRQHQQQQQSQQGFDNNNMDEWNSEQQQQRSLRHGFENNMSGWNSGQQQQRSLQQGFNNNMDGWNSGQQQQRSLQQGFNNNMDGWNSGQQQQRSLQQGFENNMSGWNSGQQQFNNNNNMSGWNSRQQQNSSVNGSSSMGMMGVGMRMGYPSQWSSGSSRSMSSKDQKRRRYRSRSPPLPQAPKPPRISQHSSKSNPSSKSRPSSTTKSKPTSIPSTKSKPQPTTTSKSTKPSKPTTTTKTTAATAMTEESRRRRNRNRGRRRTLEYQPEIGEPGGLDDPLRKGLSGCGVRWYLRYLSQGFPKEEARLKAEKHKTNPAAANSTGPIKEEKVETVKKVYSIVNPSKIVSVSLMAKEHPEVQLSKEQLTDLEEAIVEEMANGWEIKLQFEGIRMEAGSLVLDCANRHTARWLKKCVTKMNPWKGVELKACFPDEIEKAHTIFVKLPKSAGQETSKSLSLIATVNVGLSTEDWEVVKCEEEDENQLLTIKINKPSFLAIKKNENKLRYRFGKVDVEECENELPTSSPPTDTNTETTATTITTINQKRRRVIQTKRLSNADLGRK